MILVVLEKVDKRAKMGFSRGLIRSDPYDKITRPSNRVRKYRDVPALWLVQTLPS